MEHPQCTQLRQECTSTCLSFLQARSIRRPGANSILSRYLPVSMALKYKQENMTNKKLVVSGGIEMAVGMAMSNFSTALPKPLTGGVGGCYLSMCGRKALSQKLESPDKIITWVDHMRASSPVKSHTYLSSSLDHHSWMASHPSALKMFDSIMKASKGRQILVFLDYDGTLSPIVKDPDQAFMSNEMRATVKAVAKYFPTAIVTGRSKDKVYDFVKLKELYYAGSHGMDIQGPAANAQEFETSILCQPARQFLPILDEVYKLLVHKTKTIPGAMVENNKFCLSVHFRCVEEKKWPELAEQVKEVLSYYPQLKMTNGRKVLEIKPTIKWDKGNALEFLLEALGLAKSRNIMPIYIGDDKADEDAFKALRKRKQGLGILVSKLPKETGATYTLQDPYEVMCFLQSLVEWRQKSLFCYRYQ